jgi:iron-sulfur cluster assembly accessory protein
MNAETPAGPAAVPVTLTPRAVKKIAEILRGETADAKLRIAVTGGGCSGFQYNFVLDETPMDDDLVIEKEASRSSSIRCRSAS